MAPSAWIRPCGESWIVASTSSVSTSMVERTRWREAPGGGGGEVRGRRPVVVALGGLEGRSVDGVAIGGFDGGLRVVASGWLAGGFDGGLGLRDGLDGRFAGVSVG